MSEKITIEGNIENIIYSNSENGYTVFSIFSEEYGHIFPEAEIICVGYVPNVLVGEIIKITGTVSFHNSYGKQLKVEFYEKCTPKTEQGIEKYLASGIIKGLGKIISSRIVKKFGVQTFDIIEKEPERLAEIKGISLNKAMEISKTFVEESELRDCILFLQNYNISTTYSVKIYKHFKSNTIPTIKTNPYRISEEIFGIGFKKADEIAQSIGIEKSSSYRIKSAIKHILSTSAIKEGNVYLPENELLKYACELLEIEEDLIKEAILSLNIERQICIEKIEENKIIFLNSYYQSEKYVAQKLLELSLTKTESLEDYDKEIKKIEKTENISFASSQKKAIKEAMVNGVLVIKGGPGTGKTTTINAIISLLKEQNYEIELTAPTGRAAKRMTETTGVEAQTIHKLLGINYVTENASRQNFEKNEDNPIEADVIIVDECSMIDIVLMSHLLKAISNGTRLILVGDVDQLPSVGAGMVLKDIICSNVIKVVSLDKIFRQAQESAIITNAHKINKGEYPTLNEQNKDFFFIKKYNQNEVIETIVELITERLPKYLNCNPLKDIQVLSPMKKSLLGVGNINSVLQKVLNPPSKIKTEKEFRDITFREGDKVMQIKNNYNISWEVYENNSCINKGIGIFNGDEGVITKINLAQEYLEVLFDESKIAKYEFSQLDELDLSYAITVHKSQGSEYKAVVIPIHNGVPMLFNRNLLYTAITRAKTLVVIVGIPETLYKMVDNNREINRYTNLKNRLINLSEFINND